MATVGPRSRRVERLTIVLPIERLSDTGWLKAAGVREFARMLDEAGIEDKTDIQVWWTRGPQDEPPRLEVIIETKINQP